MARFSASLRQTPWRRQTTSFAVATGIRFGPSHFPARHQQSPPANHLPSLRTPFGFLQALDWLAVVVIFVWAHAHGEAEDDHASLLRSDRHHHRSR